VTIAGARNFSRLTIERQLRVYCRAEQFKCVRKSNHGSADVDSVLCIDLLLTMTFAVYDELGFRWIRLKTVLKKPACNVIHLGCDQQFVRQFVWRKRIEQLENIGILVIPKVVSRDDAGNRRQ
jgi:hypothetical protein